MGGNLPPDIDEGADNLYQQGCYHDGPHEVGHVETFHYVDTSKVANDGDDVRYHASFAVSQLDEVPSLIAAVKVYEQGGEENGEQIGQQQYLDFVVP